MSFSRWRMADNRMNSDPTRYFEFTGNRATGSTGGGIINDIWNFETLKTNDVTDTWGNKLDFIDTSRLPANGGQIGIWIDGTKQNSSDFTVTPHSGPDATDFTITFKKSVGGGSIVEFEL